MRDLDRRSLHSDPRALAIVLALLALPACFSKRSPITGALTTGAVIAPVRESQPVDPRAATAGGPSRVTGVELRAYTAMAHRDLAIPNAYGFAVRQLGASQGVQSALQLGWAHAAPLGRSTLFIRGMFDLISWTEAHDETTLSALSPTLDVGIAPFGRGICVSASATWDVKFNEPDRALVGAFVGLCGGPLGRR